MSIVRWYPSRDVNYFQENLNRMVESFFRSPQREDDSLTSTAWMPPVDVYETENEIVLKAELPEIDEKNVKIGVENNTLTISGERNLSTETKEDNYRRIERSYGSFTRSFTLSSSVDTAKISAKYKDGILKVVLPKREEAKPRQVKIAIEKE